MVQSDVLPDYILNADTKLTLYKNCRNTAKIAETSIKFLSDVKMAKLKDNSIEGESPELYFERSEENVILRLNQVIDYIKEEILKKIMILLEENLKQKYKNYLIFKIL